MKLSLVLFLMVLLNIQASTYSQQKKISLNLKEVSIEQALSKIEALSGYNFLYNDKQIKLESIVTIKAKNEPVSDILQKLFVDTNIVFSVIDNQIILKASPSKPILKSKAVSKTTVTLVGEISGKVIDEKGQPIPNANIIAKGTAISTQTDVEVFN